MAVLAGVLGTCGAVAALVALGASNDDPGGVLLGAQIPDKTRDALLARKLLTEGETLLAYHDATVGLDMSDVTFITAERIVHANGPTVASAELASVQRIVHRSEGILGDVIEITTADGRTMRVAIAPLNGGESYVNVLEDAWRSQRPSEPASRIQRTKR